MAPTSLPPDLFLAARRLLDGAFVGSQPSRLAGTGAEFSQYRPYQPGDDPRRVDWRLLARSDRYFVREAEAETRVAVRLVVDATGSMAYAEGGVSSWMRARELAAALALVAHRQGDAVGLALVRDDDVELHPPMYGLRPLQRLLDRLARVEPSGPWPAWAALERVLAVPPRGISVLLTDLHERADELAVAARKLAAVGHDVMVIEVRSRRYEAFDWHGPVTFEDLESGARLTIDADAARAALHRAREEARASRRGALVDAGVQVETAWLDEDPVLALRRFLAARSRAGLR